MIKNGIGDPGTGLSLRAVINEGDRIGTAQRNSLKMTRRAGRDMPVFKEQVQVRIIGSQVNGGAHALRYLLTEEQGGGISEFTGSPLIHPNVVPQGIEHIKILAIGIQGKS